MNTEVERTETIAADEASSLMNDVADANRPARAIRGRLRAMEDDARLAARLSLRRNEWAY